MKRHIFIAIALLSVVLSNCKSKSNAESGNDSLTTETSSETPAPAATEANAEAAATNEPKTYTIKFSPDSATLGKQKEASIKLVGSEATELSTPDGKSEGIELTFKISMTNRNKIGSSTIGINPSDFRLVLDNNTSISQSRGSYLSVEPESTKESEPISYRLPAGTKPKALNLFYDETRASVGMSIE